MFDITDKPSQTLLVIKELENTTAYMDKKQVAYFKRRLEEIRKETLHILNNADADEHEEMIDPLDRASQELDRANARRGTDLARNQLKEINEALERIADGSYGYCDDTGEEIGLARLVVKPTAKFCIEAQTHREILAKTSRL